MSRAEPTISHVEISPWDEKAQLSFELTLRLGFNLTYRIYGYLVDPVAFMPKEELATRATDLVNEAGKDGVLVETLHRLAAKPRSWGENWLVRVWIKKKAAYGNVVWRELAEELDREP